VTAPRHPDYDRFVAGLDALRHFAESVTRATTYRDIWRFALAADAEALARRLADLAPEDQQDALTAAALILAVYEKQAKGK
jgi:hypothetical protein